jgi:putative toxin-antitoxin system antitoxin component (TIGR02293 family)
MLPNYDAKAVAEVLGLAFLRGSKNDSSPAPAPASKVEKGRFRPIRSALDRDFVIHVDNAAVLIVESKAKNTWAPFARAKTFSSRLSNFESHISSPSSVFIEKAVEKGLPRQALRHVAEWLAGGDKTKVSALEWGVVPKTTLERRETKLSPQESERTERIARLFVQARRALGTEAEAREFMTTSHPELDGRSPIDAAKTDLGTRRTEQLLTALEYGLAL